MDVELLVGRTGGMAEVAFRERRFVEAYIVRAKRDRYLSFLKGRKHRRKILDRLNHNLDVDDRKCVEIEAAQRNADALLKLLRSNYVEATCYLMADGSDADGRELRLELGVEELLANPWGSILICPPEPIALYKEEDIGRMFLLGPHRRP